ncbi:hypothetical protein HCN44_005612 [Aphidius gifuensis]|uniref:Protein kinase domain-containing protein n=1 Tax=Aphidius gifuensis TaxID=684658 RepID=A0A834Y111_APHGI|nr:hypothetical protein HCN44_005612 [Aphidius gifuensis]
MVGIEYLGPTFMKLGQWVATRRDLFSNDICDTLSRLQRQTPAHSWTYTRSILKLSYGEEWKKLFVKFDDDLIGSGCFAEFFKLRKLVDYFGKKFEDDNELYPVAVKILHPGIESCIKQDLKIINGFCKFATWLVPSIYWLNLSDCIKEFSKLMENQVDMKLEAKNLLKFRKNFKNNSSVIFPKPILHLTNNLILVESFHEGKYISNYLNSSDKLLKKKLAKIGIKAILKMIFHDNFIHCDLHPGNILVQENNGLRLVLLDCGLVSSLNDRCQKNLRDVFRSLAKGDGALAGDYIMKHSDHMTPDPDGFKKTINDIVKKYMDNKLNLNNVNMWKLMTEFYSALVRYQVHQDGAFINVVLSIVVIEDLGKSLDPSNDILLELLQFIQ